MHFDCHPVDSSFFDTAPMRFRHEVDLDAAPAKVFAIFDDENSWPKWFKAIHKVEWTSPRPHGVGATRTVKMATATIFEHFFCWEQDRRCSFYLTGMSMPLANALAEDYLLEEVAPGKTHFTYRVAIEPRLPVEAGGPLADLYFDHMFKSACEHLQTYVREV
ncbi:SRPBCC family protein [Variovorax sp. J22R133]|uniref:SRPBCC family protein n=1 Tax=Variovorax brevis TaxID=3053503 RepID=UPI0025750279|nr:SRPBCC family protein [Variovorax sp. J22R133]MDM0117760.1 SRPBCC family protein [Variovorax sp. J22R133]